MLTLSKENLDQLGGVLDYDAIGRAILANAAASAPGRMQAGQKQFGWKHDVSGAVATSGYMHGPGGLLRYPGVDPAVFQTIVGSMGILSETQFTPTTYVNPTFETLTGITGDEVDQGGSEPAEICDDAPTSGQKKGCIVQAPFGRYKRGTREVAMSGSASASTGRTPSTCSWWAPRLTTRPSTTGAESRNRTCIISAKWPGVSLPDTSS